MIKIVELKSKTNVIQLMSEEFKIKRPMEILLLPITHLCQSVRSKIQHFYFS